MRTIEGDLKTQNVGLSSAWRIAQMFPLASCLGNSCSMGEASRYDDDDD